MSSVTSEAKIEDVHITSGDDNNNYATFENKEDKAVIRQPKRNATIALRSPEQNETEKWKYRLFGCMEDRKLCLWTCLCPCFTAAKNAGYFYEDENEVGLAYCLGGFCGIGSVMRWRTRQHKKLQGHMLEDVLVHMLCPCCALIQENREIFGEKGSHIGEELIDKK